MLNFVGNAIVLVTAVLVAPFTGSAHATYTATLAGDAFNKAVSRLS